MATTNPTAGLHGTGILRRTGTWLIAIAVVFILLGIFAILEPVVAGLAVAFLVGWLLIFGGVAHLIAAFSGRGSRVIWAVILGILYFAGGIYFLTHPLLGLGGLTLLLASIVLAEAAIELIAYFRAPKEARPTWMLVNAVVTLLLGGLIWLHWPSSSEWAIGTLVGVNLLMTGISRLMVGTTARRVASRSAS
jgi:uncharacterized membrane protein HdeD (DUF308 family)